MSTTACVLNRCHGVSGIPSKTGTYKCPTLNFEESNY